MMNSFYACLLCFAGLQIASLLAQEVRSRGDQTVLCADGSRYYEPIQKCDGVQDCDDNSDEEGCPKLDCPVGQRACAISGNSVSTSCINEYFWCDGHEDCLDGSDEANCLLAVNLKAYPESQVIKEKLASEGQEVVIQCRDESLLRARVHWIREDGQPLPPGSTDNDGRLEIPNARVIHSGNYVCTVLGVPENTAGRTVISHLTVEKEVITGTVTPRLCKSDEATCSNGECIPKSRVCDGKYDCTDGTDEIRCSGQACEPNQFRCGNKECVSQIWKCDGDRDCIDGSDEENCTPSPPGSPCNFNEYQCAHNNQCILKSFQCDREKDCLDGSDEIGCSEVQILLPPPRLVILKTGETFTITCTALGIPLPEISWRLNWGYIPAKCTTTSINGTGTLVCPLISFEDQGAYSCEATNTLGWKIATPDTILTVERPDEEVCPRGQFNSLARTAEDCISCFCFGVATECASADLFTYQLPAPFDQYNIVSVETYPDIKIQSEISGNLPEVRPVGRNGVHVIDRYENSGNTNTVRYFALPESYHDSQLKSYGGYLKYTVQYEGQGSPNDAPSVILTGNNYVLTHKGQYVPSDYETEVTVRFFVGDWVKKQGWEESSATREEIMMALVDVDNILIKVEYDDGPTDTTITNVFMDTAGVRNTNQGAAAFVEECRCPAGYTGFSCEHCESGYSRRDSGQWLGQCYKDEVPDVICQPGYYKDLSRNVPCQPCPCVLTDPLNRSTQTCHLGADGQPTCDCPQGYLGRRCEQCAPGYQGNPFSVGGSCVTVDECDSNGSISPYADPATGVCSCKTLATGRTCNECKANTFHLAATNKFGCISCFCMGVTMKCTSSNWYRSEIHVPFTSSLRDFSLMESKSTDPLTTVDGIYLNQIDQEIVYDTFPNREIDDVYYWHLPSNFLENQLASYGGNLKYAVRYISSPGSESLKNNAADVLLSSYNDINLRYFSTKKLGENITETFTVPLLEDYWQRIDGTPADREHLLMALADVQAIQIKATYTKYTDEAALSSVFLDTAVDSYTGKARAIEVEQCSCPTGYRGLSCEDCDVGYTRDDSGLYLGSCIPCSCNGHSTQCDSEFGICENCRDHTTGEDCELCDYGYVGDATRGTPQDCQPESTEIPEPVPQPPKIVVTISETPIQIIEVGSSVTYHCAGRSEDSNTIRVEWQKEGGQLPAGRSSDDTRGILIIRDLKVSDSGIYVCQISDGVNIGNQKVNLTVEDSGLTEPRPIIEPRFLTIEEGNPVEFHCRASGNPQPQLSWIRVQGEMNPTAVFANGIWRLQSARTSDEAEYKCIAQNRAGVSEIRTILYVNERPVSPPDPLPIIEPANWTGETSGTVRLVCTASQGARITWTRSDNVPLPVSATEQDGILTIYNPSPSDSGYYICTAITYEGVETRSTARVTIQTLSARRPTVSVDPERQEVNEGTLVEVKCIVTGDPTPVVTWTKYEQPLSAHIETVGNTLRIVNPQVSDRGVYVCHATNSEGNEQSSAIIDVHRRPVPLPEPLPIIEPANWTGGTSSTVRLVCSASEGAQITWTRSDNVPLPVSATEQDGILTIYNPSPSDSGYYICTAITYEGVETRSTARVTIQTLSARRPTVSVDPERQEVNEGTLVEVKCIVTGDPTPVVTWTKYEQPLSAHIETVGNTLRIVNPQVSDRGVYVCHATNSEGNEQSSAIIDVHLRETPGLELFPQKHQIVPLNGSVLLFCRSTSGVPAPSVSWAREDGRPFSSNVVELPGGNLRFSHVALEDGGSYVCSASNEAGYVSLIAVLEISTPPVITITPPNRSLLLVKLGERVRLTCAASGQPKPMVQWNKHGINVPPSGAESRTLLPVAVYEINSVSYADEGSYTCFATNAYGPVREQIQIRIDDNWEEPITSTTSPDTNNSQSGVAVVQESLRIPDGGKVEMRCQIYGSNQETIYLDWKRNDNQSLRPGSTVRDGILIIPAVTKDDTGEYICQGLNGNGDILFTATSYLEIIFPPRIELDPARQVVMPGDSPLVTCRVTGDEPILIEWHAVDRPLPSTVTENLGLLQFNGITSADAGNYVCKATNNVGTAEAVALVWVNESNRPITNQRDINAHVGAAVNLDCPADARSTISWSRENGNLPRNSIKRGNLLELTEVSLEDSGRYICQITTESGASSSNYINLRVESQTAAVNIRIRASRDLVNVGDTIDIQCDAPGVQNPSFRWTRLNEPSLPQNAQEYGNTLRLSNVAIGDSGIYRCTAVTPEGTFDKDYQLIIQGGINNGPHVETQIAPYGTDVVIICRTEIEPPVKFQWHKLNDRLPVNSRTFNNQLEIPYARIEDAGTYICTASNSQVNTQVRQILVVTGVVPRFSQVSPSYLSFSPLPESSLQNDIEVSFKPESYDGIILYNNQFSNGTGDFLALSLVGGYPEFRFDLGSGPVVIRGRTPITLETWHTIKLQRNRKEGTMFVDGKGPYTGTANGRFMTLNLSRELLHVGGVPDYNAISQHVDVNSGFIGCISRLVIDDEQLDLTNDPISIVSVDKCEACAQNLCRHGGVCQEAATENGYTCLCPPEYSGKYCTNIGLACYPDACGEGTCFESDGSFACSCPINKRGSKCEIEVSVTEVGFHNEGAYLAFQTPRDFRTTELAMDIKPSNTDDGILMYSSESNDSLGGFIALLIKDGHVEFRSDLGSGLTVLRSNHIVQPGVWLHLQVSRDAGYRKLSINNEQPVIDSFHSPATSITPNTLLYIGGVNKERVTVNKNVGVERDFRGCISGLDIAGQAIDIPKSVVEFAHIEACVAEDSNQTELPIYETTTVPTNPSTSPVTMQFDPCTLNPCVHGSCHLTNTDDYSCICEYEYTGKNCEKIWNQCVLISPCINGGICTNVGEGFKCDCLLGFNGRTCETPAEIYNDVGFRGDGWLELDRSIMTHKEEDEVIGFEFSTNKSNGVIMWHGQTPDELESDDYISLAVVDGYVEYQYNLGSGPAVIRNKAQRVDDGERHKVILKRQGSEGRIELNGKYEESGASEGLQQLLNARGSIYLGGVPNYAMTYGKYQDGFSGCIYTFQTEDSRPIVIGDAAIRGRNVYPCTSEFDRPPIRGDGGIIRR